MQLNYCMQCGRSLVLKSIGDEGQQKYCPACERFFFDNPASCVLVCIVNEQDQVLMLKQNYISDKRYTLCSGYVKKGDTLEETVQREVLEETGQRVLSMHYVQSYYFHPKGILMAGFIARVQATTLSPSAEVDELLWCGWEAAAALAARENNFSGEHLERCWAMIKRGKAGWR
ncbi:MAG: NUDIX domain-containing protein [Clostridia bacterium]|nr:NUDIX domain-containing protein [Clostridia bacterium]